MRDLIAESFDKVMPSPPDAHSIERLEAYMRMLIDRAEVMNLVADPSPDQIAARHFADSAALLASSELFHVKQTSLIDVGSGAGFPGLVLKMLRPDLHVTLLDAGGKRCAFLSDVVSQLALTDIEVINARAEVAAHNADQREHYDIATSRAVADMSVLTEICLPFVRVGGELLAMKSRRAADEVLTASRAISLLGGQLLPPYEYDLSTPTDVIPMSIVRVAKTLCTPTQYPRNWAKIKKAPL